MNFEFTILSEKFHYQEKFNKQSPLNAEFTYSGDSVVAATAARASL